MSNVIEQKILEMRFDNKQFEDNVSTSISTLEKLKSALNFDKIGSSFDAITDAAKKVDLSPVTESVQTVVLKFNALELAAVQAIANIITNGFNRLQSVANSLSFDQINAGWTKYEQKTESVQTIMAATGKSIEEVSAQLQRLNWFSDETSYSFTDMTSNVGKFTSVGIDLEKSVSAMEGIATWAALSGGKTNEAARAMYNLAQAMGVGAVKLMDWRSIENAGMATAEFKEIALESAVAVGTLTKSADGLYTTLEGTEVTVSNFNSTLADGWFSADALMAALDRYGGFANELSKACEETGIVATDFIEYIEKYKNGTLDINKIAKETGLSAKQITPWIEKLSSAEYELGMKAFLAGQQAKTFSDAIDATKDAVSTGWMNTFELLFGNFEQAAEFFTEVTGYLWDIFAADGEVRNSILKGWAELGGGDLFRDSLLNIMESVTNVIEYIRKVIYQITGVWDKQGRLQQSFIVKLLDFTEKFAGWTDGLVEFTSKIQLTGKSIVGLKNLFNGIGDAFGLIFDGIGALRPAFEWFFGVVGKVSTYLMENVFNNVGIGLTMLREYISKNEIIEKISERVGRVVHTAWEMIKAALQPISDLLSPIIEKFQKIFSFHSRSDYVRLFDQIREKLENIFNINVDDKKIWKVVLNIRNALYDIIGFLTNIFSQVKTFLKEIHLEEFFTKIWDSIKNIGSGILDLLGKFKITKIFGKILDGISSVSTAIFSLLGKIDLSAIFDKVKSFGSDISAVFTSMFKGISDAFKKFNITGLFKGDGEGSGLIGLIESFWEHLKRVAENIGKLDLSDIFQRLTQGIFLFSGFNFAKMFGSISNGIDSFVGDAGKGGIGGFIKDLISPVTDVFDQLKETIGSFTKDTDDGKLKSIAIAIGILTVALIGLSGIESDKIGSSLGALAGILAGLFVEMKAMSKLDLSGGKQFKNVALAVVEISAAALVMSLALKPFAEMEWDDIGKAMVAMTAILSEFLGFIAVFGAISRANQIGNTKSKGIFGLFQKSNGFDKQMKNVAAAMIELGAAMKIFASAAKDFGEIDKFKQAIAGLTAVMLEMVGFIAVVSLAGKHGDLKNTTKVTMGMVELGVAMKLFASALAAMAAIKSDGFGQSIVGLTAVMTYMVGFIAAASLAGKYGSAKDITKITFGMIELAAAMKIFASAMADLATIKSDGFGQSIVGLTAAVVVMGAFILEASLAAKKANQILEIAASMVVLGAAMKIFASAMNDFASLNPTQWINALAQMGAVFAGMMVFIVMADAASSHAAQIVIISASLIVLGEAMKVFASAASSFTNINWETLGKSGAVLAGLIIAVGALGAIGGAVGPGLTAIGAGLAAIGAGITLIGIGFASINIGLMISHLTAFSERLIWAGDNLVGLFSKLNAEAGADAFIKILKTIVTLIPETIGAIIAGVISAFGTIIGSLGEVVEGAKVLILSILDFIVEISPKVIDTVLQVILGVLKAATENVPEILSTLLELLLKIADELIKYVPQIVAKVVTLLVKVFDSLSEHIPTLLTSFMNFLGKLFGEIMNALNNASPDAILKMIEMVGFLDVLIISCAALKAVIPSAMAGLVELGLFVAELSAIIAALGALNSIPGFGELVGKGGNLLELIGTAIGKFVGGIIGGFAEGATSTLPNIGKNISKFWENIQPFIEGVKNVGKKTIDSVSNLSAAILMLTAADLLDGITKFITGGLDIVSFGENIAKLGPYLKQFAESVKGIDTAAVATASETIKTIAEVFNMDAFKSGGVVQWFSGETKDLKKFGEGIRDFGPLIKQYADSIKGMPEDAVMNSEIITKIVSVFDDNVFKTGGFMQALKGELADLQKFGEKLVYFGPMITTYAASILGLPDKAAEKSLVVTKILESFDSDVFKTGGLTQFFSGETADLKKVGEQLQTFGPSIKTFANSIKDLSPDVVTQSTNAAQAVTEFIKNFQINSFWDNLLGKDKVSEITSSITSFGTAIKNYYLSIANVKTDQMDSVLASVQKIVDMFSGKGENSFKIDTGFIEMMKTAAVSGITQFTTAITERLPELKTKGAEIIKAVHDGIEDEKKKSPVTAMTDILTTMLETITEKKPEFALKGTENITEFINAVFAEKDNAVDKMAEILSSIIKKINSMPTTFKASGMSLINNFIAGVYSGKNSAVSTMGNVLDNMLSKVTANYSTFKSYGLNLVDKLADGFYSGNSNAVSKISDILTNCLNKIEDNESKFETKGENLISKIISGMEEKERSVNPVMKQLLTGMLDTIEENIPSFKDKGRELISGLPEGMESEQSSLNSRLSTVVQSIVQTIVNNMSTLAGEMVTISEWMKQAMIEMTVEFQSYGASYGGQFISGWEGTKGQVQGMLQDYVATMQSALESGSSALNATGRDMGLSYGYSIRDGLEESAGKSSMSIASNVQSEIDDAEPVITPVLDLSNVRKGLSSLDTSYTVNAAYRSSSSASPQRAAYSSSVDNSTNYGAVNNYITVNANGSNAKQVAEEIGYELSKKMRVSGYAF